MTIPNCLPRSALVVTLFILWCIRNCWCYYYYCYYKHFACYDSFTYGELWNVSISNHCTSFNSISEECSL